MDAKLLEYCFYMDSDYKFKNVVHAEYLATTRIVLTEKWYKTQVSINDYETIDFKNHVVFTSNK